MTLSYQLYSSRDAGDWATTLSHLSNLGYDAVEGFGGVYADPSAFRGLLDANGLTMPSGHFFPVGAFQDGLDETIAAAKTLGMQRLYCPAPEDDLRNGAGHDAWIAFAVALEEAGKKVRDAGLAFGWHNHHWEFMALPSGVLPMELILENAPTIEWEVDVAWIVRGGQDPLDWIRDHGGRMTAAHVKDIAPEGECADEDGWADVGQGVMDWPGLLEALKAQDVSLLVMEHDKPNDANRFATRSMEAMKSWGAQ
jgi:sugar phosphate isomerase/epimerase